MKTEFIPIDINKWNRREIFYYFSKIAPTTYSITSNLDLSRMMKTIKENNLKFFPSFLWLTTTILNEYDEFRVAVKDDKLGHYTILTPFYPTFHSQDHSISMVWTEYSSSLLKFHNSYEENKRLYGDNKGFMAIPKTIPPENACNISVLPWFNFTSFSPTFFLSFPLLFSFY